MFIAGINTETHKYYIDVAAANHIRYNIGDDPSRTGRRMAARITKVQ
jgi:hypothetical protein